MREPSVIVKRHPLQAMIIDLRRKVAEKKQTIQKSSVELQSLERDLYLLEKSVNVQPSSSES